MILPQWDMVKKLIMFIIQDKVEALKTALKKIHRVLKKSGFLLILINVLIIVEL